MSNRDDAKRLRVRDDSIAGDLSGARYLPDPGTPCLPVAQTATKVNAPIRPRRAASSPIRPSRSSARRPREARRPSPR